MNQGIESDATDGTPPTEEAAQSPAVSTSAVSDTTKAKRADRRAFGYRLQQRLHRLVPDLVRVPISSDVLATYRAHDADENLKTTPSVDQAIDLRCLWAVEFYTPSQTDQLIAALRKLGLEELASRNSREGPISWLKEARSGPTGGWMNLGYLTREKPGFTASLAIQGPLPDFAESVSLAMFNIAPSFVAIAAAFLVEEKEGRRFEVELRKERTTFTSPTRRGYSIIGPESQKRSAVESYRKHLREEAKRWYAEHLPGLFSRESGDYAPPVCEFLVLTGLEPFACGSFHSLADLLDVRSISSEFVADEWPGVRFAPRLARGRNRDWYAALAAAIEALPDVKSHGYGDDRGAHAAYFESGMTNLMVQWGSLAVVEILEWRLSQVRDLSLTWTRKNADRTLRQLQALTRDSLDLSTVCRDLVGLSRRWHFDAPRFLSAKPRPDGERTDLRADWAKLIPIRARRLLE